jgi:ribosomal protein S18 acetylase RimI-like enzyme
MSAARENDAVVASRLTPADWEEYKAIRLEALQREPAAFASTYAQAVDRPDELWRQQLANARCTMFVARAKEQPVGLVGACRAEEDAHAGEIISMYVNAGWRRQGVGRRLLAAAIDHLATIPGITVIRLLVSPDQVAAQHLYAALGFQFQGREDASRDDSRLIMERPVQLG